MDDTRKGSLRERADYHQRKRDETNEKLLSAISKLATKVDVFDDQFKKGAVESVGDVLTGGYAGFAKDIFKEFHKTSNQPVANALDSFADTISGNESNQQSDNRVKEQSKDIKMMSATIENQDDKLSELADINRSGFFDLSGDIKDTMQKAERQNEGINQIFAQIRVSQSTTNKVLEEQTAKQAWFAEEREKGDTTRHKESMNIQTRIYRYMLRSNLTGLARGWNNFLIAFHDFKQNPFTTIMRSLGNLLFRKRQKGTEDIIKSNDRITRALQGMATDPNERGFFGRMFKPMYDKIFRVDMMQLLKGNYQTKVQSAQQAAYQQMLFGTKSLSARQLALMEKYKGKYDGGFKGIDSLKGAENVGSVNLKSRDDILRFMRENGMTGAQHTTALSRMTGRYQWDAQSRAQRGAANLRGWREQRMIPMVLMNIAATLRSSDKRHQLRNKLLNKIRQNTAYQRLRDWLMRAGGFLGALGAAVATGMRKFFGPLGKVFGKLGPLLNKIPGFTNAMTKVSTAMGKVGTKISGAFTGLKTFFTNAVPKIFGGTFAKTVGTILRRIPFIGGLFAAGASFGEGKSEGQSTGASVVRGVSSGLITVIGGAVGAMFGGPLGAVLGSVVGNWIGDHVGGWLGGLYDFFSTDALGKWIDEKTDSLRNTWNDFTGWFGELGIIEDTKEMWNSVTATISNGISTAFNFVSGVVDTSLDFINATIKSAFAELTEAPMVKAVTETFDRMTKAITGFFSKLMGWINKLPFIGGDESETKPLADPPTPRDIKEGKVIPWGVDRNQGGGNKGPMHSYDIKQFINRKAEPQDLKTHMDLMLPSLAG